VVETPPHVSAQAGIGPRGQPPHLSRGGAGLRHPGRVSPVRLRHSWWPTPRLPDWLARVLVCVALTQSALNLARPATSYRALALGADERAIGLVTAAYAVVPVLVALPLGRLADRRSPAPLFVAGTVGLAAGCGLLGVASSLEALALASAVLGFGHLAFMVGGQTLLGIQSDPQTQDRDYGLYTAVTSLGQLIGPALAGFLLASARAETISSGTTVAFLFAAVLATLALPLTARVQRRDRHAASTQTQPSARPARSAVGLLRLPGLPAGLFASLALLAAIDVLTAYLPVLGEQSGVGPSAVGLLLSLRAFGSILSRLLLGRLVIRWGRVRLIVGSTLGSAVLLAAVPLSGSVPVWSALLLVSGFLLGMGQPLTMVLVVRAAPPGAQGRALAMRLTGNRLGQMAVPSAAGLAAGAAGAAAPFWLLGGLLAVSALAVGVTPSGPTGGQPERHV
jgi:MFS family permease